MAIYRVLTREIVNPRYIQGVKRGLPAIRAFEIGLQFVVNIATRDFIASSSTSIDIPSLRLASIIDKGLVGAMLNESRPQRPDEFADPAAIKPQGWVAKLPPDEMPLGCGHCGQKPVKWIVTMGTESFRPVRMICEFCGHAVMIEYRAFHALHS